MAYTGTPSLDSFGVRRPFDAPGGATSLYSLPELEEKGVASLSRLPFSIRILLENLLRFEDGTTVTAEDIEVLANWDASGGTEREIAYRPARVLLQDFTGVPAIVDLAAMRDAMARLGGDPNHINPLLPAELVIDHSVQVDSFGSAASFLINAENEFERNRERYAFLRWGQTAFDDFRVVPPDTGIVHQINLEYLARVVFRADDGAGPIAYPDTLVGTDSHTTMINGLGVLGWGVGGIEAEAALLGQPISLLIPQVVGFRLHGTLGEGTTATDLVLRVTEMLRERGVVGKFVEFYGPGLRSLSLADRATLGNMSPEFGATCAIFPVDAETLDYLRFTGRADDEVELVEAYMRAQRLFHTEDSPEAEYSDRLDLDLATVEPSLAGPRLPQQRIRLADARQSFERALETMLEVPEARGPEKAIETWEGEGGENPAVALAQETRPRVAVVLEGVEEEDDTAEFDLHHGSIVIAAITSCTNTSNPSVMVGAGLLAKKAVERGLRRRPWVKTSLAPGSMVVTEYLNEAGLMPYLEALGFYLVGYGCTTCIGNSGPLPGPISEAIHAHELVACSVLSGNRNFEGRINPDTRANYLASPPLVVAYSLAGRMDIDLYDEPIGQDEGGADVYLRDLWPTQEEVRSTMRAAVKTEQFTEQYANVFEGDERWKAMDVPEGDRFEWQPDSTYVREPPFFIGMSREPTPPADISGARVLALLGDSVTTDHISPAGSIPKDSPAGHYLMEHGVQKRDFNSFGSRRGNHEVMMRGTFGNIRLRNQLVPGVEGGYTRHLPDGRQMSIYDAAMKYTDDGVPSIVIAGKEYGTGSSRDWAAKGPRLLGVQAVIARSYERIHRSNLIGMGVMPLEFIDGASAASLGLDGTETFDVAGIAGDLEPGSTMKVAATRTDGSEVRFDALSRIDTAVEVDYYRNGGILHMVLRQLLET